MFTMENSGFFMNIFIVLCVEATPKVSTVHHQHGEAASLTAEPALTSETASVHVQPTSETHNTVTITKILPTVNSNRMDTTSSDEVTRVVNKQSRNFEILSEDPKTQSDTPHDIPSHFLSLHPHTIHITHIAHEQVHPLVNKRSLDSDTKSDYRMLSDDQQEALEGIQRKKRNFAVPPEDFQPQLRVQAPSPSSPVTVFVIEETDAFLVDPADYYIRVNNTNAFGEHEFIQFYVYLADSEGVAISNPLPFIVYIDRPGSSSGYPVAPAVFAGVLVLCVVFLAVLIPLVTRAKRRYKQGKPMFKLGSHPSRADLEKVQYDNEGFDTNRPAMMKRNSSVDWYGEGNKIYYNYEEEVAKEQQKFTRGLKQMSSNPSTVPVTNRQVSTKSEPPRIQLHKNKKSEKKKTDAYSDKSSSSGIETSSGADGIDGEDTYSQKL